MNRRGFLGSILAFGVAPAIVRADSLMRIVAQETTIFVPNMEPLLLVPETSFASLAFAGPNLGRSIAVSQMLRGVVEDGLKYGRPVRELRIFEDREYCPREDVTLVRATARFVRETPRYVEEAE